MSVHVVLADRDSHERAAVAQVLAGAGHRVTEVADGAAALQVVLADPPDLVVSEVLMPRMDGYRLCRAIKSDAATHRVPFAFYTAAYADAADEAHARRLGADAFWRKPMAPRDLLEQAERLGASPSASMVQPPLAEEPAKAALYDTALVEHLEAKARKLEEANEVLRRALDLLAEEVAVKERLIGDLTADVVARERVEDELRQERDFSRTLVDVAELFICVLDVDLRVTLFSKGAEELTGYGSADIVGRRVVPLLVAEEHRAEVLRAFAQLPDARVVRCACELVRRDGERRALEATITCTTGADGRPLSYSVFGVDLTERRRLNELKSQFIQTVSHELRTPLTSIVGFVDLLAALPPERLAEQAPEIVERLRQNAARMRVLVEELLEVNDIAADGISLSLRPVDLAPVVRRAADAVYRTPGHTLTVEVAPGMPSVVCDAERIGRVVSNLVSNAVKYSPEGGAVQLSLREESGAAVICVSDEGVGIPKEGLADLFDRFTQADMSSTRAFGGMGLGLYIVDEIVRAHGGSVEVASEPGKGSTFTVRIPLRPA